MMGFGTKARAGSAALFQPEYKKTKTIVYVAPRVGWAPMSLAKLCSDTGRKLILFSPAAAKPSHHQLTAYNLSKRASISAVKMRWQLLNLKKP
jgi:hypothetical protein